MCTCQPSAMPIEASRKGGSLPSSAESSGAASPLRRPCRNCKTGSHIRERWRAHGNGVSVHMHPRCLMCTRRSAPTLAVRGSRSAPRKPTRTPWRHLYADPRTGPLRSRRSSHRPQEGCAPRGLGRSSRALRLRSTEASTTPGGRLDQSSKPPPHYTGDCSLIDSPECLTTVDRFPLRHVVRCDEYKPSRRRSRPTSPNSVQRSASSTIRSLYDGANRRRSGLSTTSGSGAAAALRLPSQVSGAIPFSSILSRCPSILDFSAFALL